VVGEAPAPRSAVYERALAWFAAHGYALTQQTQAIFVQGEKRLSATPGSAGRIGVVSFRIDDANTARTRYTVHGWTEEVSGSSRSKAGQIAPEVNTAVQELDAWFHCSSAGWPAGP
jgi:hypothetical protein